MRKQLVHLGIILAFLFLNSCAVVPMIAGGVTLGCASHDTVTEGTERCPALVEVDKQIEKNAIIFGVKDGNINPLKSN